MGMQQIAPTVAGRFELASRTLGFAVLALGVLVLVGWSLGLQVLKSVGPGLATMKANTALAFVLTGGSLVLATRPAGTLYRLQVGLAAAAAALGLSTLAQYAFAADFGIDRLLFAEPQASVSAGPPGRMSMATAAGVALTGCGLALLDMPRWSRLGQTAAALGALIGLVALMGYATDVSSLYGVWAFSSVAVHTALALFAVNLGSLFARPREGWMVIVASDSAGGHMARRLLPFALGAPLVIQWLGHVAHERGLVTVAFATGVATVAYMVLLAVLILHTAESQRRTDAQRQVAQRAQVEQQAKFAGIVGSAMDAVISVDAAQNIVLFNAAAERMFACPAAQALGQPLDRFLPVHARAAHGSHVQAFGRTGVTSRSMRSLGALMALRADGVEFPIEASISQVGGGDGGGQPIYTVILRDISERVQAERTLRDSEDRLRAVTENLTEGLVIFDLEGQVLHMNAAAVRMHDFQTSADALRRLAEFTDTFELATLAGEVLPMSRWPLSRLLAGEPVAGVELHVRRLHSNWARTLSYSGAVVHYAGGQKMAFLSVTDVSEAHRARAQVAQLNAELEQRVQERTLQLEAKSRELESFCYSVSHDLKAPLRGIDGYSRLLLEECAEQLGPDGQLFANNVRAATRQMTALIEDLLSYSRQERRSLTVGRVALRRFVDEQLALRSADLQRLAVTAEVADVQVLADREALAVALRNLLDNAIKFTAKVEKPTLAVRARIEGPRCVLSVQDNGAGFDMRFHDRIFQIFQRLHRVEEYPGTGIGLALVRKAAERMGGRVWATSAVGKGAAFHLELALADAGEGDGASADTRPGGAAARHPTG